MPGIRIEGRKAMLDVAVDGHTGVRKSGCRLKA